MNIESIIPPQVGKNRLLNDTELARWNYSSRANYKGMNKQPAWPQTIRYNSTGGKSNVELSDQWENFLRQINTENAFKFLHVKQNGYMNFGPWPKMEMLSFGGNFVEVTKIDGDKCYIKHYSNDQTPPDTRNPNFYDETLIQNFWVTRKNNTVEAPPCGMCRTLIISKNSSEQLWIPKEYLTFAGEIKKHIYPEIITVKYSMNVRNNPDLITGKIVDRIPLNSKTKIEEVTLGSGDSFWGKLGLSKWICLRLDGIYFTDWRP